mgnify:CR=1 FL=1
MVGAIVLSGLFSKSLETVRHTCDDGELCAVPGPWIAVLVGEDTDFFHASD